MRSESTRLSRRVTLATCVLAALMLGPRTSSAEDAGATTAAPAAREAGAPAGHAEGAAEADASPHGQDPHGQAGQAGHGGGGGGMFEAPEDGALEDPTLPTGTIEVHIADPTGKAIPRTDVTLGILFNSVAKGESRKRVAATTNEQGKVRFDNLEPGSGVAYRAMVFRDGATFSVPPFRLPERGGMRAVLHVYPVESDVEQTLVVSQAILYAEVKDDRIQVQQAYKIYNFGKNAWVPNDLVVPLPEQFTAFSTQQGMTDVGVDAVPKKGVRLRGTFPPGQHVLEFRWQLPYSGESEVRLDVGTPPHTAAARVIAPASKDMVLDVPGFPAPQSTSDGMGQRALITEKQLRREDPPLRSIAMVIRGLPTEGPGKIIATLLAASAVAAGIVLGTRKPTARDRKADRARLLAELEELELAHQAGDVGPKTYARARQDLVDAIARTFVDEAPSTTASPRRRPRTA